MMDDQYDVIILGAGPGGASAAIYTARAKLKTLVVEKPGRNGMFEMAMHVSNYPGIPGPLPGMEILSRMRAQAESFGAQFVAEAITAAFIAEPVKRAYTVEGGVYQAHAIIIATGALERTEKVPGEAEYWGRGVSGCTTCDAPFYQGKIAVAVGDDDYAAEETRTLAQYAVKVYLMTPSNPPQISPEMLTMLQLSPAIEVKAGWKLREIVGADGVVRRARFQTSTGDADIAADGIFLYLGGSKPSIAFLQDPLPMDEEGAIITSRDQSTAVPGVYAVGDVTAKHVRQAVVAAGEGCIAALAVVRDSRRREQIATDYGE